MTVEAFDAQCASNIVKGQIESTEKVNSIQLDLPGKKGFLGIGKKPSRYLAAVSQQAVVKIAYKSKARISAKIGKNTRSADENRKLDKAERGGYAIDIACENCGRVCKASPKLISRNTIMVMTPEIAIIASRYCERCNIVVCGACVGVSPYSAGPSYGGRPCPKCGEETDYAAVRHLRMTCTKLV